LQVDCFFQWVFYGIIILGIHKKLELQLKKTEPQPDLIICM
jgi:hypothetical protein